MKDKELRKLIGSRAKPVSYTHLERTEAVCPVPVIPVPSLP